MELLFCEKSNLPVPTVPFEEFYVQFDTVYDLKQSKEWQYIYSNYYDFEDIEDDIKFSETLQDLEAYSFEQQREEWIKCMESFSYFAHKYIKILHPMYGVIPFILYKYQIRTIKKYEENRFNIISKFRQGGLTTLSVLWGMWRCLFRSGQQIMTVSITDREAIVAGEVVDRALEHLPSWIFDKNKPGQALNKHEKEFVDTGSAMRFYTPKAARGKSITFLIIDEAAHIPDMETHYKAIYPVISAGGSCCVVSTVNGMGNWYQVTYHKAENGDSYFKVIDLDYWEHPVYANPEWAKTARANMGEKSWRQEVLRDFLNSGDTFIQGSILLELANFTRNNIPSRFAFEKWFSDVKNEKRIEWDQGALWIWKEPIDGHEYIIGVDAAEGVGETGDNSAFQVIDVATLEQVAEFYSNTIPPHVFSQIVYQISHYYNIATLVIENMGPGVAVLGALTNELAYENLYIDIKKNRDGKPGVKLDRTNRPACLEAFQHRVITGTVKINSRRLVQELDTFIFNSTTKKPEAKKGKHDDAIMSLALAIWVRDSQMRDLPMGAEAPEEHLKIMRSEVFDEIKREIMEDYSEDWLVENSIYVPETEDPLLSINLKRKNERLLKEFGW